MQSAALSCEGSTTAIATGVNEAERRYLTACFAFILGIETEDATFAQLEPEQLKRQIFGAATVGHSAASNRTEVRIQLAPPSSRVQTIRISCSMLVSLTSG
jgi:hypothetical protein